MKKYILLLLGFCIFEIISAQSPKNLTLLDTMQFPGQRLAGCWHYNDTVGNEYAIIGAEKGIVIADITNPSNPILLFQLPGVTNLWHEVKVLGDYAYAVSEGSDPGGIKNGVQIIDLRFLPDSAPYKFYYGDSIIANQLVTAHTITATGKYIYVNGHNIGSLGRGVLILDISDPWNPAYTGAITNRYCHDSYVRGDTIYTSDIQDGLFSVYDISNRSNPVLLATQITPGQFNHNTWLSDNGLTIFAADEQPNVPLAAYDISDLNNITLLDTFYNGNFTNNEVHNIRVKNDFLINPSYGSQLTLADASRPNNIIEVGNYTTGSSLCWDADPYLNSGNIIATDMNSGIFYIFQPTYTRACYLEGTVTDSVTGLPIINASVVIQVVAVSELSDFSGAYYTGYADSGTYIVSYSKTNYYTKQISVSLQNGIVNTTNVKLVPVGTGINNLSDKQINIFPNPANDIIHISASKFIVTNWKLTDDCGRLVLQSESDFKAREDADININSLPTGFYTLELQSNGESIIKQIVKR